jgi:NAD(P)-dependent dehydrogenase (short-subunit alcohol dehydrogenase family)
MEKKTAILTGANSGIGEAITKTLSDDGWRVIGLTRQDCDLSDLAAVEQLANKLKDEVPIINALIHVAGVYHSHDEAFGQRDLEDYSPEWITATMNVGVTSLMILASRLLPNIAKDGAVIGVSGTFEFSPSGWLPYYTSKRALEDFLVGLAADYKSGPRVYGVSPSDTITPAYTKFFPEDAKNAQPATSVSLLVAHLLEGDSPYHNGDIVVVKHKKAAKGFHL